MSGMVLGSEKMYCIPFDILAVYHIMLSSDLYVWWYFIMI